MFGASLSIGLQRALDKEVEHRDKKEAQGKFVDAISVELAAHTVTKLTYGGFTCCSNLFHHGLHASSSFLLTVSGACRVALNGWHSQTIVRGTKCTVLMVQGMQYRICTVE